jgi:hypothetical protein
VAPFRSRANFAGGSHPHRTGEHAVHTLMSEWRPWHDAIAMPSTGAVPPGLPAWSVLRASAVLSSTLVASRCIGELDTDGLPHRPVMSTPSRTPHS